MDPNEEYLATIGRAIAGDMQAMESVLYAQHARLTRYVAKHMPPELRGAIEPSDIVQDTWYDACRLFSGFEPRGEDCLFRWLVTITRHRMVTYLRAHRVRAKRGQAIGDSGDGPMAELLEELAVHRRTPSLSAARHETMLAVERAIAALPEEQRQAITLRHIENLSVEETAQRIGRTEKAVYWLTSRALATIREELRSASLFL